MEGKIMDTAGIILRDPVAGVVLCKDAVKWGIPKGKVEPGEQPIEAACRETLEETEDVFEEIVCTLTQEHVIEQVIVSGGMVIPEIKQQIVFSTEEFPNRLLKKSKDLFGQVVDLLEDQFES